MINAGNARTLHSWPSSSSPIVPSTSPQWRSSISAFDKPSRTRTWCSIAGRSRAGCRVRRSPASTTNSSSPSTAESCAAATRSKPGILFPRRTDSLDRLLSPSAVRRHRQQSPCHGGHAAAARRDAAGAAALLSRHGRIRPSLAADAGSSGMGALPGAILLSHRESLALSEKHADPALVAVAKISDGPRGL